MKKIQYEIQNASHEVRSGLTSSQDCVDERMMDLHTSELLLIRSQVIGSHYGLRIAVQLTITMTMRMKYM